MLKKESRMKVYFCTGFLAFVLLAVCLVLYLEKRERAFADVLNGNVISVSAADIQRAKEFYVLTGLGESEAETEALISSFGTPEEYWQYEFTVYEKNLPIQNYVEDMEEQFHNRTETASSLDGAYEEGWDQYFENYKNRLVQENSFRIVQP